ncbi:MAG: magnesium transporter MgtE N-terminal domain-containing protein, partial [Paludibacteraceae bacterium]
MTLLTTLYLSRLLGCDIYDRRENILGKILDVYMMPADQLSADKRHVVAGFKIKIKGEKKNVKLNDLTITKFGTKYKVQCNGIRILADNVLSKCILLKEVILDKQIVDISGHKLVRVNDIRMVFMDDNIYIMATDVGTEGLLRRLGINQVVANFLKIFHLQIPARFILWDDVESVDPTTMSIHLSKTREKLNRLHPSDLADIIEDLGRDSQTHVFSVLDEEKAADVLEEMEAKDQVHIIESLTIEKAADVLEKMPADEAAYI